MRFTQLALVVGAIALCQGLRAESTTTAGAVQNETPAAPVMVFNGTEKPTNQQEAMELQILNPSAKYILPIEEDGAAYDNGMKINRAGGGGGGGAGAGGGGGGHGHGPGGNAGGGGGGHMGGGHEGHMGHEGHFGHHHGEVGHGNCWVDGTCTQYGWDDEPGYQYDPNYGDYDEGMYRGYRHHRHHRHHRHWRQHIERSEWDAGQCPFLFAAFNPNCYEPVTVNSTGNATSGRVVSLTCASNGSEASHCAVPGNAVSVRLADQQPETSCTANQTFGADAHSVWVSNGCSAKFVVHVEAERQ